MLTLLVVNSLMSRELLIPRSIPTSWLLIPFRILATSFNQRMCKTTPIKTPPLPRKKPQKSSSSVWEGWAGGDFQDAFPRNYILRTSSWCVCHHIGGWGLEKGLILLFLVSTSILLCNGHSLLAYRKTSGSELLICGSIFFSLTSGIYSVEIRKL